MVLLHLLETENKYFAYFEILFAACFCGLTQTSSQTFSTVVLLAAGTGITPMLQIASSTLRNPCNKSRIILLSFSKNDQDVCLHQDLIDLKRLSSPSFTLKFFASQLSAANPHEGVVQGSMQAFTAQMLFEHAGVPSLETTVFCMCGPSGWIAVTQELLRKGGVPDNHILAWT